MYFVMVRQAGFALFAMTPNELGAIGLVDDQKTVRLLERAKIGDAWNAFAEWSVDELTHSDYMAAMQDRPEITKPRELLEILPESLRSKAAV